MRQCSYKHPTKTLPVLNVFAGAHASPLPWGFFCSESLMMLLSGGLTTASAESEVQEASKPTRPEGLIPPPSVILQYKPHPYSCQPPSPNAKLAPACPHSSHSPGLSLANPCHPCPSLAQNSPLPGSLPDLPSELAPPQGTTVDEFPLSHLS